MVIIGIDAHTATHAAAAIDEQGRVLELKNAGAASRELDRLLGWIRSFRSDRLVAVEGARGLGLALVQRLVAGGERVVEVPAALTAEGRRRSGRAGKTDEVDAVTIARVALREPGLPQLSPKVLNADLKLLVDTRDQLVQEATRVRNRLHALLLVIAPGYQRHTGALTSKRALRVASQLASRAGITDVVRSRLARAAIRRLRDLERETTALEREIVAAVEALAPTALLSICGVGPLVAGKILAETRDVTRFRSSAAFAAYTGAAPIPASSGTVVRHRLNRGGNRQLNRALFTVAMTQARWDPRARAFLAKKRAEGKSPSEARRALKRHLANSLYQAMRRDLQRVETSQATSA